MKNRITALVFTLVFAVVFAIPVLAVPQPPRSGEKPSERLYPLLVDDAELLSDEEEKALLSKLGEISARQKMDVALITVKSIGARDIETYTDDYYDYFGYGQGDSCDGVMFLISMDERQTHITTTGSGTTAFTDAGRDYILDKCVMPLISEENYAAAFDAFATQCDDFITQAKTGKPYDVGNLPKGELTRLDDTWIIIAIVAGIIVTVIVSSKLKKQMKTVEFKPEANSYAVPGSLRITGSYDTFVTTKMTSRVIKKDSSDGSSTHTSSSGTSHGGSSRSF